MSDKGSSKSKCLKYFLIFFVVMALIAIIILVAILLANVLQSKAPAVKTADDKTIKDETQTSTTAKSIIPKWLTIKDVEEIKKKLVLMIKADMARIAGWVRLVFHDCVGNCDGCIDKGNSENDGLKQYITDLEAIYTKELTDYQDALSHADYWQLAGITALEQSSLNCSNCINPWIQFLAGRRDCDTAPWYMGEEHTFPNNGGHANIDDVLGFFEKAFELPRSKPELAVALLGAHSLGRAHAEDSGWSGPWVRNEQQLSQNFYSGIIAANWTQINITRDPNKPRFQWHRISNDGAIKMDTMLLNADLCLHKVLSPITSQGQANCTMSYDCPKQPETARFVQLYANDIDAWQRNFAAAYFKMTTTGYDLRKDLYVPA